MDTESLRLLWIGTAIGAGIAVVMTLIAAAGAIPKWSVIALVALGCVFFLAVAIGLDWIRVPHSLAEIYVKSAILFLLIPLGMIALGWVVWPSAPQTRPQVVADLTKLAQANKWDVLAKRLPSIENDPSLRDVGLYFRGMLYLNASPAPDPEQYLSQVPQESEFFSDTQRLRVRNLGIRNDPKLKAAIIESLERANLKIPIYYMLRLQPPPTLTYRQVTDLYGETKQQHNVYNFSEMKSQISGTQGVYMSVNLNDVFAIPSCVLLFLLRQLQTARFECVEEPQPEILDTYEKLTRNTTDGEFSVSSGLLSIDYPALRKSFEQLRLQLPPAACATKH